MEVLVRKPGTGRPTHDEGDVFAKREDGACGRPGSNSVFWLIHMPGEHSELWDLEDEKRELIPINEQKPSAEYPNKTRLLYRRKQKLDFSKLPELALSELKVKGTCVLPIMDYKGLFITK